MKKTFLLLWALCLAVLAHADYFVEITRGTSRIYYATEEFGTTDFQGRQQFVSLCVPLQAGDILKCYDGENQVSWAIAAIDQGATWGAPGFTLSASGVLCSIAGSYDLYIKLKYEDDVWYIEGPKTGCTAPQPVDPDQPTPPGPPPGPDPTPGGYTTSAPAQYPGVMLQGFYWNSYQDQTDSTSIFGRTKWVDFKNNGQAVEIGKWFDLVWLPPSSKSSGGLGYHPIQYSSQDGSLGAKSTLKAVIDSLHRNGCRVVADIVVNHCDGSNSWCKFNSLNFDVYGRFQPTAAWICNTDEMNNSASGVDADCLGKATGGRDDGYGSEANYGASRDWDHNQQQVRDMIKAYLKYLRYIIGYDGFRYDYCKGFHMSHVNEYNTAAQGRFSVIEYWDGNAGTLQSRLNDANWNTLAFDFANYYTAIKGGIAGGDYSKCRGAGLPGQGKARYACTFADSHDTFQRGLDMGGDLAGYGSGESVTLAKDKVLACNAYILSMPGVPCVFYPHWVTFKTEIKAMINARYMTGVHSESSVSDEAGNGFYKATITGTNGEIRLLLGPNSGYGTTPSGYTLAAKGVNWGVYYKTNSARTSKELNRTAVTKDVDPEFVTAIPSVEAEELAPKAEKVLIDGVLYLRTTDGTLYNLFGSRQ